LDEEDEDQLSAQANAIKEVSIRAYDAQRRQESLASEIEQFKAELMTWGITMDALVKHSPKHQKLRETYKVVVSKVCQTPDIVQTIQLKRYFPIKTVSELTKLPQKTLERARTFIIASLIIKLGDYDYLSDYVSSGR
jgi:RNA polymerase sigma factor